jgi:hypothetical protein
LSTVPPRKRAAVVAAVVAAGPVTAKAITTAAAPDRIAKDKPKPPTINDKTGLPIPTEIHKHWHRAEAIQGTVSTFASARGMVERAQKESDVIFAEVNFSTLRADIDRAIVMLKVVRPYAVCPTCQGLTFKDCGACHGRGFVSEHFWKRCVPEETKSMRSKIVAELKKKANEHS